MRKDIIVNLLNTIKDSGCRYCSLVYTNSRGETARYVVNVGVNMTNIYKSDLEYLCNMRSKLTEIVDIVAEGKLSLEILDAMITSTRTSLAAWAEGKENENYTSAGKFEVISRGIKQHKETKDIYIVGFLQSKKVLIDATNIPNIRTKTAKAEIKSRIRKGMKISKIRNFKLTPDRLDKLKFDGVTLTFGE